MVQRSGCLSDPGGYVLGRFQVKGKTPGRPFRGGGWGGGGGLGNSLTITVHADRENNKN